MEAIFGVAYGTDGEDDLYISAFLQERRHALFEVISTLINGEFPFLKEACWSFLAVVDYLARFLEDIDMIGAEGEEDDSWDSVQPFKRVKHACRVVHRTEGVHGNVEFLLFETLTYAVSKTRAYKEHLLHRLDGERRGWDVDRS